MYNVFVGLSEGIFMLSRLLPKSISRALLVTFALLLTLLAISSGVGAFGINHINAILHNEFDASIQLRETALDAQVAMLEARRYEKDYLLRHSELGLEVARTEYVLTTLEQVNLVRAALQQIITLENQSGHQEMQGELQSLLGYTDTYETQFLETVDLIEERGLVEEGLIGSFRSSIHDIEAQIEALGNLEAQLLMLEARRREKDYMLRGDLTYVTDVHEIIDQLKALDSIAALSPGQAKNIRDLADAYVRDFDQVVALDGQIAVQIEAFQETVQLIEPVLLEIVADAEADFFAADTKINDQTVLVMQVIAGITFAALLIGFFLTVVMTRRINRPLETLIRSANQLGEGDLTARSQVKTQDEFGNLSNVFNKMAESLSQTIATERSNRIQLEETVNTYLEFVEAVASGELSRRLDLKHLHQSDEVLLRLGKNLNQMTTDLEETITAERETKDQLERTVAEFTVFIRAVAEGDLSSQLSLNGSSSKDDDLSILGNHLNQMVISLGSMARQIRAAALSMTTAASEIQSSTTQQSSSATEQDITVTETVSTVEELRITVSQTSERAQAVTRASYQAIEVSQSGQQAVLNSVNGMQDIQERVADIAENILILSERTQQIGEIIDTVNGLADQSKLLALNASIEAARAGEEGKGFAVVAMEVRQLAEQSREATARVRDILGEIQQATNTAVMVTEEGSKVAENGVTLVEQAGNVIDELSNALEEAAQLSIQIVASTEQQNNGMDQLLAAMQQIKQASTQTAASTRQAEQSSVNLIELARQLEDATARYQLA